jgi:hypothetical protein
MQSASSADRSRGGETAWTHKAVARFARDNEITIPVARAIIKNANYSETEALKAVRKMRG